jgi:hypothetical protein
MAPTYRVERDRGSKEFPQQLVVLRERWPLAFPTNREDVRPLAMGTARAAPRCREGYFRFTYSAFPRPVPMVKMPDFSMSCIDGTLLRP